MKKLLMTIGISMVLGAHLLDGCDATQKNLQSSSHINDLKTEQEIIFDSKQLASGSAVNFFGRPQIVESDSTRGGKRIVELSEHKFQVCGFHLARKFTQLVQYKDKNIGQSHWVNPTLFTMKILAGAYVVASFNYLVEQYT